jgi:hypothetical protein
VRFHHLGCKLCLVCGRLGFWYRGFCCLSSSGYMSRFFVCSLFLYVCISLSLVARMLLLEVSFFIAIYVYVGFFGYVYVISEGWVGRDHFRSGGNHGGYRYFREYCVQTKLHCFSG